MCRLDDEVLISVVVPVYNAAKYLPECIDSIEMQNYKNLQIICINDGSTDESGRILDECALNDRRIYVVHKKNGGVSSARNVGVAAAKGKYTVFVDADDYIEPDYVSGLLMTKKLNPEAEVVICPYIRIRKDKSEYNEFETVEDRKYKKEEVLLELLERRHFGWEVFGKLFQTKDIKNQGFPENIKICEDLSFVWSVFINIENYAYTKHTKYRYRNHNDSATEMIRLGGRIDGVTVLMQIFESSAELKLPENIIMEAGYQFLINYFYCIYEMFLLGREEHNGQKQEFQKKNCHSAIRALEEIQKEEQFAGLKIRYGKNSDELENDYDNLILQLRTLKDAGKAIYIYGAGDVAKQLLMWINRSGLDIDAYIISEREEKVVSPDEIHKVISILDVQVKNAVIIVGVNIRTAGVIIPKIKARGISNIILI